jgi:hypothetical protein
MCQTTAARVALIRMAAGSSLHNCFVWLDAARRAVLQRSDLHGLTLPTIHRLARIWIVTHNGAIDERDEHRGDFRNRREYFYGIIIPVNSVTDFPRGLWVEMELSVSDPDCPVVSLLNAHPETSGPRLSSGGIFLT